MVTRIEGDQVFVDDVNFAGTVTMKSGQIDDDSIEASADLAASKLEHQFPVGCSQGSNVTAHDLTEVVHAVYGDTGSIIAIEAGSVVPCTGSAEVDVDLLVGGASVLASPITLDSSNTARTGETGTVSTPSVSDGNVIEVSIKAKGPDSPDMILEEDFMADAGDTLPALWAVDAQTVNSTEDYVTDQGCGVYTLTQSSNSEAQASQLFTSNNHWIDLFEKPIIEWRAKLDLTGTNALGSADQRLVMGVCSDHTNAEDALDAVTTNAWFRMEGTSANILVEADDNTTNTDDQDSTVNLVDNTWTHFKIDFSDLSNVKFYVDGTEQGGAAVSMAAIAASTLVQPIACIQRAAGAEEEKMYLDSFKITQGRTGGTLAKGVYCTVMLTEKAA